MSSTDEINVGSLNIHDLNDCIPRLRRFARSMTRDDAAADDLLQDCLERAVAKSHLFDGENLNAWLTTICKRMFLNSVRQKRILSSALPIEAVDGRSTCAEATQEEAFFLRQVLANLERLSEGDQRIIALAARDGLEYVEIAREMEIKIGTVRSRLSRARAKLRRSMEAVDGSQFQHKPRSAQSKYSGADAGTRPSA